VVFLETLADMGIWRSIFGWRALFRWDALGAVVPGIFLAGGLGVLGLDWFPHHLLISQLCLGIATFLCIVKIVGHAVESTDTLKARLIFGILLTILAAWIGIWVILVIQKHKSESPHVEVPPPSSPTAAPPINQTLPSINQTATDSDCSNIVSKEAKVDCEIQKEKKKDENPKP
jgi:hypothetical protein